MPCVMLSVPETHESVVRPVISNVVRNMMEQTGIPVEYSIMHIGQGGQALMKGSTVKEDTDRSVNTFDQSNRVKIDFTEDYLEQHALTSAVKRTENVMVFSDQDLGVSLRPAYTQTEVTLNVEFRTDDRQSAERWRDDFRARASLIRDILLHDVKYHYPIPKEFLVILNHINELKERQAGHGESLKDWFKRTFTPRVTSKVTMAGTAPTLAINEQQVGIIGKFDFDFTPEQHERNDAAPSWVINFTYSFVYEKPTSVIMEYPLLVHNQLISSKFRDKAPPKDFEKELNHWSLSRFVYDEIRGAREFRAPVAGFPVPHWDDWLPRFVPPFTTTLFQVMLAVNPDDQTDVMSFSDLQEEFSIDEDLVEYMKNDAMYLNQPGESIALFTLFRDEIPLESHYVTVDDQLNVRTTVPMDLRRRYHLRIALVNDPFTLSRRAKEKLRRKGDLAVRYMRALFPELDESGKTPKLIGNNYMTLNDFKAVAQAIKDTSRPHQSNIEITRLHVGTFVIRADK